METAIALTFVGIVVLVAIIILIREYLIGKKSTAKKQYKNIVKKMKEPTPK